MKNDKIIDSNCKLDGIACGLYEYGIESTVEPVNGTHSSPNYNSNTSGSSTTISDRDSPLILNQDETVLNDTPPTSNNLSNSSGNFKSTNGYSPVLSNQNKEITSYDSNLKTTIDCSTLGYLTTENSCNAVDNKIRDDETSNIGPAHNLSFNGKIIFPTHDIRKNVDESKVEEKKVEIILSNHYHANFNIMNNAELKAQNNVLEGTNISTMIYRNERSPDLFADEDLADEIVHYETNMGINKNIENNNDEHDEELLKRIQTSLSGVLPPPSLTQPLGLSIETLLNKYNSNYEIYTYSKNVSRMQGECDIEVKYLFKPNHTEEETINMEWPKLLDVKAHGVSYNKSTVNEKIEYLAMRFGERYIGAETTSSFVAMKSPSSSKKRSQRMRMLNESPGNRLSHLARRRSVFTSTELLRNARNDKTSILNPSKLCNGQILLNTNKSDNRRKKLMKTPKRRGFTPKRKTPGSSKKKLLLVTKPVSSNRETSKRALFQSPPKETVPRITTISREVAQRADKTRRALFSPAKKGLVRYASFSESLSENKMIESTMHYNSMDNIAISSTSTSGNIYNNKRMRADDDFNENISSKIPRMEAEAKITPNTLRFARSQTFCVSENDSNELLNTLNNSRSLYRANSDFTLPGTALSSSQDKQFVFTINHKKKILWAVSQALQNKKITVKHEKFKDYATVMARIVKKLFLEYNDTTTNSTSEKLLKFANNIAFSVIKGKSYEEIYNTEKIIVLKNMKTAGRDIYERRDNWRKHLSEPSEVALQQVSQSTELSLSQSNTINSESESIVTSQSIKTNYKQLTSSTSKNNEKSMALRENIDIEAKQKSIQKLHGLVFSGKDQKNVSPYSDGGSNNLTKSNIKTHQNQMQQDLHLSSTNRNIIKAKRQISFDT